MLKPFDQYTLEVWASVDTGLAAQILCHQGDRFVGRIDFYANQPTPVSYIWHPNGTSDPDQVYIVLAMPVERFDPVEEILRIEGPLGLELWPDGEMTGVTTDGYGGVLRSLTEEPVGTEEDRRFFLAPRPANGKASRKAPAAPGAKRADAKGTSRSAASRRR